MAQITESSICCIFNLAPHYRESIYKLMDKELNCDFYIGDNSFSPIKKMNYSVLIGFKKTLKFIKILGSFYWQKDALSLSFKPYKFYIITGEPYCISTWFILFFNKLFKKETILWSHGWYGRENSIKKFLKKIFFSMASKVMLYGDYARNCMIKEGFSSKKLSCIYNSLDYDRQIEVRQQLHKTAIYKNHFKNNNPVILYIGRIQKAKKIDLLLRSVSNLNEQGTQCNLVIIGEEIEDILVNYNIEKALSKNSWFYGACYDEEKLGELIFNSDVCVSPGNVGLTAMHSLVYGTPVITHDDYTNQNPEFEAITDDITGSFFKKDSVESLCEKIEQWIGLPIENREFVRNNCYEVIEKKYNPYIQINMLKSILNRV